MLKGNFGRFVLAVALLVSLIGGNGPVYAVDSSAAGGKEAVVQSSDQIVIKFKEGVNVTYADGAEQSLRALGDASVTSLLSQFGDLKLNRLFDSFSDAALVKDSRTEVFQRYFTSEVPKGTDVAKLLAGLNKSALVETAYLAPTAISDPVVPYAPNTTPVQHGDDPLFANQAYGQAAPEGINSPYAWQFEGGDGKGITYVDVEQGWALQHEDLAAHNIQALPSVLMPTSASHGSSVLGVISAVDNAIGHAGLANKATPKINSWRRLDGSSNIAEAILTSVPVLQRGDVILIEVQSVSSTSNGQWVPMEVFQAEFDAIRYATDQGITVVEAGANGSVNLDTYQDHNGKYILNRNSPDFRDSGAVMVGAASSAVPHDRMYFSSFGNRIDSYGYGENVHTLSAIDLNSTTGYTTYFAGTSSASPIVTSAVISLQGIAKAQYGKPYSPEEVRSFLRNTSWNTPSANPGADQIGYMPNLKNIIDHMPAPAATTGDTAAPSAPLNLAASNVTSNSVQLTWSASTDNVGVTGYDIFRNGLKVGTAAGTSFAASGLTGSTTYTFAVKAKDAAGNVSAASQSVSVTTSPQQQLGQTFVVSVPANTPANAAIYMYVHGYNNSWSVNDPNFKLTKQTNGTYTITLNIPIGTTINYNFSRGTWGTMETNNSGGYVSPRLYTVSSSTNTVPVAVARWSDL